MANVLQIDKKIAIISALTEDSSIRSVERMTGLHRDTIMRLGVKIGRGCMALMNEKMVGLPWLDDTGEPGADPQHVTVLHIHPALTPLDAVRAFIMQEIQSARA